MYKVLLVDDENLVIKSLEAGVDWKKSGFSVAGKANNGIKALQLVNELKPHIVFTDIRMPGMSGLELIKKIKELDKDIQIIVISGYAEFAYVQKSLNYGVLGYCLKPFDDYEIDTLLRTAAKVIDEIKQKREGYLLELMDDMSTEMSRATFNKILSEGDLTTETLHVLVSLGKGRLSFNEHAKSIGINLGSARSGYFVQNLDQDALQNSISEPIPEGILGVGIVRSERNMNSMMKSIERATVRAWDFFVQGRKGFYWEENETKDETANQLVRKLEKAAAKKDPSLLHDLLDEMLLPANKQNLNILHALKIYNIVYFHASSDRSNTPEDDYIFSKEQLYHLFHSFDSMIGSLKEFLSELEKPETLQMENKTEHANLKEIIKYMNENYRNDISIQSISKSFYLNSNYLSQLFKRELKFTFTEYLTKVRLQEAKNLLQTTDLSIGEIAENIGFRDYFYFIRIFKKHTQQTPRQFRLKDKPGLSKPDPKPRQEERT
ncbi:response regulator transcription factor [Cohnella silvisoli]|uniref:Response regulator n=1 Tax=Cohnella silvisoli TaxID=2873699 RepID=A0ABV1L193_9BACL|nr:response regulator [Cohnella silvisoli]MCD9024998.1 response regulator [Cohnella silvisoli]